MRLQLFTAVFKRSLLIDDAAVDPKCILCCFRASVLLGIACFLRFLAGPLLTFFFWEVPFFLGFLAAESGV